MMTVATREHLKISPQALDQLIEASRHDIRQVLHNLSVLSAGGRSVSFDDARLSAKKDVVENIFESVRRLFTASEQLSLADRSALFFSDYSLVPLFVQENYARCVPSATSDPRGQMRLLAEASKMIAAGDVVDRKIRNQGNWSLLNVQDMFSTSLPTELLKGYLHGRINFPSWFGKNSKTTRLSRQLQQLHVHTCLRAPVDINSLLLDYVDVFRDAIVDRLVDNRIEEAVRLCDAYDLNKEDLETVMEFGTWPNGRKDPMSRVPVKTKAAFTRARNNNSHLLPYDTSLVGVRRKKADAVDASTDAKPMLGLEGDEEERNYSSSSSDNENDSEALLAALKTTVGKGVADKKAAPKKAASSRRK